MKPATFSLIFKFIAAGIVFIGAFAVALRFGAAHTSFLDVWQALTSHSGGEKVLLLQEIRLPREVAAILVGSALAVSGAIMQGITRNPLADPGLLGLTAGANAALAITMAFLPSANYFAIMIACFIGAAVGAMLVLGVGALKRGGFSPFRLVLAGAAVSACLTALAEGIGIYFKISREVSLWSSGGMSGTSWGQLQLISPFIIISILVSLFLARHLTILSLNQELAVGLGQKVARIKGLLFVIIILLSGASVALAGNIAFFGLMIPHIVRSFTGTDYRFVLPMSAIIGGAFMLFADTISRTISAPYETSVAAIVAIFGLPFFLIVIRKGGRGLT